MLKEWRVRNFKSFGDSPSVFGLSHLNMVCGANSSGKSTLIQTVLVIAQTLSSQNERTSLILNDQHVRLGFASDVIHGRNVAAQLEIGFSLQSAAGHSVRIISPQSNDLFTCTARFRPNFSVNHGPYEFDLEDVVVRVGEVGVFVGPDRTSSRPSSLSDSDVQPVLADEIRRSMQSGLFDYHVRDVTREGHSQYIGSSEFPSQVQICNFLPVRFVRDYDVNVQEIKKRLTSLHEVIRTDRPIANILFGEQNIRLGDKFVAGDSQSIGEVISAAINKHLLSNEVNEQILRLRDALLQKSLSLRDWLDAVRRSQEDVRRFVRDAMPREPELFDRVFGDLEKIRISKLQSPYPQINSGVDESRIFFSERIRYLGPLRDDPRMIYALPNQLGSSDVGIKGEFTAFVINNFGDQPVACPLPATAGSVVSTQEIPLKEALKLWLEKMGLTFALDTKDRGKIGIELMIAARGVDGGVDLTSVGVGVSQVLPMLTMCLLAPKGSLILLEQPELHLHPKVQSLLADFLLGIALSGRQCIVETHSERMINRVRLRIAESVGSDVMDAVRIFFVEKPEDETVVRKVEPNEYGAIPEWPEGFFDEGPDEAERIIMAANRKRSAKLKVRRQ